MLNLLRKKPSSPPAVSEPAPPSALPQEVAEGLRQAEQLRKQQRLGEALALLQGLRQAHECGPVYTALAQVYADFHMRQKSRQMLAQAVLCDPADRDAAIRLAKSTAKTAKTPLRDSIGEVMQLAKEFGFIPATIVDVGVNTGTPGLFEFFPDAKLIMIDPLTESEFFMRHIAALYPDAHYEVCAAAAEEGELTMCVYPSFGGSTVVEMAGRLAGGVDRTIPARRLDVIAKKHGCKGPYVLKIDTEGAELGVLAGAADILAETELLILETRLRPRGDTPDLLTLCNRLREYGFLPYDLIDRNYDKVDDTLKQIDLVAVRADGFFRTPEHYRTFKKASPEHKAKKVEGKLRKRELLLDDITGAG
jgi:FkbM family methyltransferase